MITRIGLAHRATALAWTGLGLAGAVVLTLSCADGPTAPAPVGSIVVAPSTLTLASGASTTLSAAVLDAKGRALEGRVLTCSSSDAALATVTGPGQVMSCSY